MSSNVVQLSYNLTNQLFFRLGIKKNKKREKEKKSSFLKNKANTHKSRARLTD